MVNPMQPALQDGPDALDAIGGRRASGVLTGAVVDRFVPVEQTVKIVEDKAVVSVELGADFHGPVDLAVDRVKRSVGDDLRSGAPTALAHPENGSLANAPPACMEFLRLVLVPLQSTDEALIDLYDAAQLVDVLGSGARLTQPSQHEPCRLLRDPDLFRQLQAADSLAGGDQQVHRVDPLIQRDFRPLEDRSRAHREIEVAGVAVVEAGALAAADSFPLAVRAPRTVRPQPVLQILPRGLGRWEQLEEFEGADGGLAHGSIVAEYRAEINCTHVYNSPS